MATIKEYWNTWLWRDAVTRIITINFIMWLVISIGLLLSHNSMAWLGLFALPANSYLLPFRLWTLVTYMFSQVDFIHMLANMLWLMLFGRLFMQSQSGTRLSILYVYGGLAGAIAFLGCSMVFANGYQLMYGASCSVMAIVGACMILMPKWSVNLILFGPVRIIWIAVAAIVFFVVLSNGLDQFLAHGMGLLIGIVYALGRKNGIDLCQPVIFVLDKLSDRKVSTARVNPTPATGPLNQKEAAEFDALLAKVSRSGYSSLTANERQRLFNLSQRIKR